MNKVNTAGSGRVGRDDVVGAPGPAQGRSLQAEGHRRHGQPRALRGQVGHRPDHLRIRRRGRLVVERVQRRKLREHPPSAIFAAIGIGISIVGIVIWVRNSLTRYLRFWLIRLVYEQREQTDRLIAALERERRNPARSGQAPARSRNATSLSTRGSRGRPSTRSPITLRWICSVPPPMRLLHCMRNCCCR